MTIVRNAQRKLSTMLFALAVVAGAATNVGAATASWDPNTEPDLAGYTLSYGTQPGVHTVVLDVGKVTTYQFNPPPGLRYYIVVQAYNTAGEVSEKSVEAIVDVSLQNLPPVLAQPANQTSTKNANVSLALSASDPEGNALQFTAAGLPAGLSIDRATGLISGRVRGSGTHQVTVTVSDGALSASRTFSWSVVNAAGKATALPVEEYVGVSGDFDGDGRPDLATYRPSSGEWRIWTSGSNFLTSTLLEWGEADDVPVPADYNGDRVTDLGVYRPSTGTWHLWLSGAQTALAVQWGGFEDQPVALDHDADGRADLALIRNGGYEILLSSANYLKSVQVH